MSDSTTIGESVALKTHLSCGRTQQSCPGPRVLAVIERRRRHDFADHLLSDPRRGDVIVAATLQNLAATRAVAARGVIMKLENFTEASVQLAPADLYNVFLKLL